MEMENALHSGSQTINLKSDAAIPDEDVDNHSDSSSELMSTIDRIASNATTRAQKVLDRNIGTSRRNDIFARAQDLATTWPKLTIFLALNFVITGIPIAIFTLYIFSVGISTLVFSISTAMIGAGILTMIASGFGLLILVPAICVTTIIACSLFFWIIAGYYVLFWLDRFFSPRSQSESLGSMPEKPSNEDSSNSWSKEFQGFIDVNGT